MTYGSESIVHPGENIMDKNRRDYHRAAERTDNGATPFVAQPCLIIGGGGFGHRAALAFKAHLIETFGQVPAGLGILAFDIDDENLAQRVNGRVVTLERDAELFCLGPIPVARIKQNLKNLATIEERLPSIHDLPPIAAARAAKQVRPVGNLALQWRFTQVRQVIQSALWRLAGRDNRGDDHLTIDPSRGIKVIQIGSLCGGTNSGMFLDLGLLVRSELEALGTLGDACTVIGVGVLPGAFRGVQGPNLASNAVAALLELEAITMNGREPLRYRDGAVIEPSRPPFDMYLLVDAVDEGGRVWVSAEDLCQMVARAALVLAASQLGDQGEGELDNLDEVLSQRTVEGHGTFFGSLGLAALEFPAHTLAGLFSAEFGLAVLRNGLLRRDPAQEGAQAQAALSWLQAHGLAPVPLLAELSRDAAGAPLAVTVNDAPASLARMAEHQIPQEAIQYVQAYNRLRVDGDFRNTVRHNGRALLEQVTGHLQSQVHGLLDTPQQGVVAAQLFLAELARRLGELQGLFSGRLQAMRSTQEAAEQTVEQATGELIRAPEAVWPFRRTRVAAALDRFLLAHQEAQSMRLEAMALDQALTLATALAREAAEHGRRLALLQGRLEAAAGVLQQTTREQRARLERRRGHPALNLLDETYLRQLYQRHTPTIDAGLDSLLAGAGQEGIAGWLALDATVLAERIQRDAAGRAFEPLRANYGIEQALADRDDYSPQARLAALLDEARPAWNIDETRLPGGDASLRRITVVGVPDHTRTLLRGATRQLVSLHTPHTVLALSLTVGAPYVALQAWPTYLAEYQRTRRTRPLHTLPAFQTEGEDTQLALALGLIFGLVFTRGVYFYYRPADPLAAEVRLAQGVANAIRALHGRPELTQEIVGRVEAEIEHSGTRAALERLTAYSAAAEGDDDSTRALKLAVRRYAEAIQANARVAARTGLSSSTPH
jgi:hypothetical protein